MSDKMTEREQDLLALGIDTRIQEIKAEVYGMLRDDTNLSVTVQKMEKLLLEIKELLEMKEKL